MSLNEVFLNSFKTPPMYWRTAEFSNRFFVGLCRVSLMLREIELRVVNVIVFHEPVPGYFGNNRGCRNRDAQAVSFGDRFLGNMGGNIENTVNEKTIRLRA